MPSDPRRLRRLKHPLDIEVEPNEAGLPIRLRLRDVWHDVTLVRRPWRIDQHWWRDEPVSRIYYRVVPQDGPPVTVFQDLISKTWARQEYG